MIKRHIWPNYYFFWRSQATTLDADDPLLREIVKFGDGRSIRQFLAPFRDEPYAIGGLRALLGEYRGWVDVSTLTVDELLADIAHAIMAGELEVGFTPRVFQVGTNTKDVSGNAAPLPASAPKSPPPAEEPESPTFPSDLDAAAQAAALAAAAASGAPFCPN